MAERSPVLPGMLEPRAEIGIFGGSGFYSFFDHYTEVVLETPYGAPSDRIALGEVAGRRVAFLPRHGHDHRLLPSQVPYRANVWAMAALGVQRLFGPCAAGSLQAEIGPGHFVFCDQFVDWTRGRQTSFALGPVAAHLPAADPYCPVLRRQLARQAEEMALPHHDEGTVVVIEGPRFSTRAESRFFAAQGWQVVNMTQVPEVTLARELGICYANVSLITDYDAGLEGDPDVQPVTHEAVLRIFDENVDRLKELIRRTIAALPERDKEQCACAQGPTLMRGGA